jgi:site-specific DNA recombinase
MDDHGTRALIYCRISADLAGNELGVQRQRDDAVLLCAARGWEVAGVFTDNDISASNGKHRPGYTSLLVAPVSGEREEIPGRSRPC